MVTEPENSNSQPSAGSGSETDKSQNRSDADLLAEFAEEIKRRREKYASRIATNRFDDHVFKVSEKMLADLDSETPEKMLAEYRRQEEQRKRDDEWRKRSDISQLKTIQNNLWTCYISGRGKRYKDCRAANFEISCEKQSAAVELLRDYANNIADNMAAGKNVILFGPSGTGKDHLLTAMVSCAIGQATTSTRMGSLVAISGPDLFATVRREMDSHDGDIVKDASHAWLLVISDMVPPSSKLTDFQSETIYRIIDHRYNWQRPTFVSINVRNREELNAGLGVAVADRLIHGALTIACDWPSYRKPESKK